MLFNCHILYADDLVLLFLPKLWRDVIEFILKSIFKELTKLFKFVLKSFSAEDKRVGLSNSSQVGNWIYDSS